MFRILRILINPKVRRCQCHLASTGSRCRQGSAFGSNALASATKPLITSHAIEKSVKDSAPENYVAPAAPGGQSGVEVDQSINARPVATTNHNKRTFEESNDDCLEVSAIKRPRVALTEYDHDELEESDLIPSSNSCWKASECLSELLNASVQPLKRFER